MANSRKKCPQCGYILPEKQLVRCPRCNMNLLEKCGDCAGCPTSLWEKGKQTCSKISDFKENNRNG